MLSYQASLLAHYRAHWPAPPTLLRSARPSGQHVAATFHVLKFAPFAHRAMWTYATCGMSPWHVDQPLELHLFAASQARELVNLLTAVAHFHQTAHALDLGHTVNFGVPWQPGSLCSYGCSRCPIWMDQPSKRYTLPSDKCVAIGS
jgi:hypothetical protein